MALWYEFSHPNRHMHRQHVCINLHRCVRVKILLHQHVMVIYFELFRKFVQKKSIKIMKTGQKTQIDSRIEVLELLTIANDLLLRINVRINRARGDIVKHKR